MQSRCRGVYRPEGDQYAEVGWRRGHEPASGAARDVRQREAEAAETWFRTITGEMFG